jgi:hypothetical protein
MSNPAAQGPFSSSAELEAYRAGLLERSKNHEGIIAGIAEIADAINGAVDSLPDLDGPMGDNLDIFIGGVAKILQGLTNLQQMQVDGLQMQAAALLPVIEQAKVRESGIVTAHRVPRGN